MSQWTHVSGIFRIDGLPIAGITPDLRPVLGTPSSRDYDADPYETGSDIPGGSEGTIQYEIIHAGDGLVWKTVAVWGDLRDFGAEDTPEIDAWFARVVKALPFLRDAHLAVRIEYGESYLLVADDAVVRRLPLDEPGSPETPNAT